MEREQKIWKGVSSQWINADAYLMCAVSSLIFISGIIELFFNKNDIKMLVIFNYAVLLLGLLINMLVPLWKYYDTDLNIYNITNQRILERKGVFFRKTSELEFYKVKHIKLEQPYFSSLLGLSNIIIYSSDFSTPLLKINGIKDRVNLKEKIHQAVEKWRDEKGIRGIDVS